MMIAFEAKAVLENAQTLHLDKPVPGDHLEAVRVILLMKEPRGTSTAWPESFFETHYGSCASDPIDPPRELDFDKKRLAI
jgi:hypothetical protein